MVLTGKAKDSFKKYFISNYDYDESRYLNLKPDMSILEGFFRMPLAMQYGVYVDWFDSVNIQISILLNEKEQFAYCIECPDYLEMDGFSDRTDAREEAIVTANEVYNARE